MRKKRLRSCYEKKISKGEMKYALKKERKIQEIIFMKRQEKKKGAIKRASVREHVIV